MKAQLVEKTQTLIDALVAARQETMAVLDGADMARVAHADSGWTVQDIINHVAWCDEWSAKMVESALLNSPFEAPKHWYKRDANDLLREERRTLSVERSLTDFARAHEAFKSVISQLSEAQLKTEFMAPWRQMITTEYLVKIMVEHEEEHREEIRLAVIS